MSSEVETSLTVLNAQRERLRARDSSTSLGMTKANGASQKKDPLVEEFLRFLEVERNAASRTVLAYRQAFTAFRAQTDRPWKKCTADNFRDYLFALMKKRQARS